MFCDNSNSISDSDLFCFDLPSTPQPEVGKILVTGGTGYIGGRLVPELLARGYDVRVMVRVASPEHYEKWKGAEIVVANGLDIKKLHLALEGVHTIYYLIHSLLCGLSKYQSNDLQTAENFVKVSEENKIERIICLTGLGDVNAQNSTYFENRLKIGQKFKESNVPVTILSLPIIIGSGSAAFEIIEHVVRKEPVIFIPYWAKTKCQPIGIRDVIKYLVGVLEIKETSGKYFEIGGQDVVTIKDMMKVMADITGKKRLFIYSPISMISIYSYIASLITPVPASIIKCIFGGCKYNAVCETNEINKYLPFKPLSYKDMLLRAINRHEHDKIYTRWSDAYPPAHSLAMKFSELEEAPRYTSSYSTETFKGASTLFKTICDIGGKSGWFNSNWLWKVRGWGDRLLMGVGTARGRKSVSRLHINDVIDFWRVEVLIPNEMLLLRAEMKLPGMGWLEFKIKPEGDKNRLSVKAYYTTDTLFGKLYWYLFLPCHTYIFKDMVKEIENRS